MTKPEDLFEEFYNRDKMRSLVERAESGNPYAIRRLRDLGISVSIPMFVSVNVPGLPATANRVIWRMTRDFCITTGDGIAGIVSAAERVLASDSRYADDLLSRGRSALPESAWTEALTIVAERMRAGRRV